MSVQRDETPVELASTAYGDGSPLVVLHGLFGSGRNWMTPARKLAADHRVWTVDLRNHGESPHHPVMSYPAMAADLLALLDRLGLERTAIIAHSMGGKAAMWLALNYPQRVSRLLVVDIAPVSYDHEYDELITTLRGVDLDRCTRREDVDEALRATVPEPAMRQFLLTNLVSREGRLAWRVNLDAIAAGLPAITGFPAVPDGTAYPGPALFLGGAASPYIRPEHEETIRRLFPQARVRHLAGAGHWIHAEQPARFLAEARRFLGSGAAAG